MINRLIVDGEALVDELLKEAVSCIKSGEKDKGLRLLKRILKKDQNHEEAWYWMSYCVGALEKQIFSLRQVLRINPENRLARDRLSSLLELAGDSKLTKMNSRTDPVSPELLDTEKIDTGGMSSTTRTGMIVAVSVFLLAVLLFVGGWQYFSKVRSGHFSGRRVGNMFWGTEEESSFQLNGIFYVNEGEEITVSHETEIRTGELVIYVRPLFFVYEGTGRNPRLLTSGSSFLPYSRPFFTAADS
jgi:tetratricopeptide (TPR) repeat protein